MSLKPGKTIVALALTAAFLATMSLEIEPYLGWLARSRRKTFCARLVAGRMGEASQLIPEDSRTAFIHDAKEIPASCEAGGAEEVRVKYQDGRSRVYAFSYDRGRFAPWKHSRLVSVRSSP